MRSGYEVDAVPDGESALGRLEQQPYQLALLDWHLPGLAGLSLLEAVCWRWPELPVIIITGYSDEDKAVAAVEYAQAYLRKPFERQALLDTVSRVLHRASTLRTGEFVAARRPGGTGNFDAVVPAAPPPSGAAVEINPLRCEARIGEGPTVPLTATEYAVLNHLYLHQGEVVPHKALARLFSATPLSAKESAALCKHHIRALRAKLEPDPTRPIFIRTVWGQGYRLLPKGE